MRNAIWPVWSVWFTLIPSSALADSAEEYLGQALEAIDSGALDQAEEALDQAEVQDPVPVMQAEIHRQRGVIRQLQDRPADAVRQFLLMMDQDSSIELRSPPYRPEAVELYRCAVRLRDLDISDADIEVRLKQTEDAEWVCPAEAAVVEPNLSPSPEPSPPGLQAKAAPPRPKRGFPVVPVVGMTAGLGTLATGIVLGVDAENQAETGIDKTGQADAANVLVGVGLGVAVVGTGWLVWQLARR